MNHTVIILTSCLLHMFFSRAYTPEQQKLITQITALSSYQLHHILPNLIELMKQELHELNQTVIKTHQDAPITPKTFFTQFILEQRIQHLKTIQTDLPKLHWWQQIIGWINQFWSNDNQKKLIHDILKYYVIEEEQILSNHKELLLFLRTKSEKLPLILNCWQEHERQLKLLHRSKHLPPADVVVQSGIAMLVDFAIQGFFMAGNSMAMQWQSDADKETFDQLSKQESIITASWQSYKTGMAQQQQQSAMAIAQTFQQSQEQIEQSYKTSGANLQQEITYLQRAINIALPQTKYLSNPILYDQYFSAAHMITPEPHTWFNVFHDYIPQSDWGFHKNTFWQYGLAPFGIPYWQKDKTKNNDPALNQIFTEYISPTSSYTIKIICTLFYNSYPFFMGIMCNKARWISGDTERLSRYRLCGLYGRQTKINDPSSRTIDFCFAEQKIIPAQAGSKNSQEQILSPLQQIDQDNATHIWSLPTDMIKKLESDPITFIITLQIKPKSCICSLSYQTKDSSGKKIAQELAQKTFTQNNPLIDIYHGIGFMAPGCLASFEIKEPKSLVYTSSVIS